MIEPSQAKRETLAGRKGHKTAARTLQRLDGGKGPKMRCINGKWIYKGVTFDTLHDALVSVWPR